MRFPALGLAFLVLLAGCSDGQRADAPDQAAEAEANRQAVGCCPCVEPNPEWCLDGNETVEALPVTLELNGCLQLDAAFPYPIAVFSQLGFQLPPGFTFASADGQTVEAFLAWWFCPEGRLNPSANAPFADVGSMFASLPVVPPSDLAGLDPHSGEVRFDVVPLTWIISSQLASDHLGRIDGLRGGYVESGEVRLTSHVDLAAGEAFSGSAPASFGVFDLDVPIQKAMGERGELRDRMWLWDGEGEVTSYLDLRHGTGTSLGFGGATLRFAGDPEAGAPPVTAGTSVVTASATVAVELVVLK